MKPFSYAAPLAAAALICGPVLAQDMETQPSNETSTSGEAEQNAEAGKAEEAAYSIETTTIGTLLDNPETLAILDQHLPDLSANPQIDMGRGLTLRQAQGYAPEMIPEEALKLIEADLAKIPAEG